MKPAFRLPFLLFWLLAQLYQLNALDNLQPNQILFDNDFEEGSIEPWVDMSQDGTQWVIRNSNQWKQGGSSIQPQPSIKDGKYFLQLDNTDVNVVFGIGKLSTTTFTAYPGDQIQFSYWIASKHSHFNTIQVNKHSCFFISYYTRFSSDSTSLLSICKCRIKIRERNKNQKSFKNLTIVFTVKN